MNIHWAPFDVTELNSTERKKEQKAEAELYTLSTQQHRLSTYWRPEALGQVLSLSPRTDTEQIACLISKSLAEQKQQFIR